MTEGLEAPTDRRIRQSAQAGGERAATLRQRAEMASSAEFCLGSAWVLPLGGAALTTTVLDRWVAPTALTPSTTRIQWGTRRTGVGMPRSDNMPSGIPITSDQRRSHPTDPTDARPWTPPVRPIIPTGYESSASASYACVICCAEACAVCEARGHRHERRAGHRPLPSDWCAPRCRSERGRLVVSAPMARRTRAAEYSRRPGT